VSLRLSSVASLPLLPQQDIATSSQLSTWAILMGHSNSRAKCRPCASLKMAVGGGGGLATFSARVGLVPPEAALDRHKANEQTLPTSAFYVTFSLIRGAHGSVVG
jgi:hypothetical protein